MSCFRGHHQGPPATNNAPQANNLFNESKDYASSSSTSSSSSSVSSNPGHHGSHHSSGGGKSAKPLAPKGGSCGRRQGKYRQQQQQLLLHGAQAHQHHPSGRGLPPKCASLPVPTSKRSSRNSHARLPGHGQHEVTMADEFEVGSVFKAGSKKTNMNHLLNFQYEPRGSKSNYERRSKGKNKNNHSLYRPKYNKEHYLQANCQFIVRSGADYTVHLNDPDTLVDWDLVEQVNLKTSSVPSCPICLCAPIAAKITRCGHVYCWACILHYLALSDNASRKCPICNDAIHKEDLKSVVSLLHSHVNIGEEIEMHLMRRERHSLFAVPVGKYRAAMEGSHPLITDGFHSYSQLVVASPQEVANQILAREKRELEQQMREEGSQPEACFIEEAMQYLTERETGMIVHQEASGLGKLAQVNEEASSSSSPEPADELSLTEELCAVGGATAAPTEATNTKPLAARNSCSGDESATPRHVSSSSDGSSSLEGDFAADCPAITAQDLDLSAIQPVSFSTSKDSDGAISRKPSNSGRTQPKGTFYFYQSSDGQAIFLHALNVQMLVHEYGSFERCPPVIKGQILEKDSSAMTEELRDKLRYLRHLPVTCNYEVCEIDMVGLKLSKNTLAEFEPQLIDRRKKRQQRARLEKRREKLIQIENNKMMGKFPEKKVRIESAFHFPSMGEVSLSNSMRSSQSLTSSSLDVQTSPSLNDTNSSVDDAFADTGPSFARMLREGVAKPDGKKAFESQMRRSETFPNVRAKPDSDSEPEPEGYVPPPPKHSMGDVLALALERQSLNSATTPTSGGNGGKKKGKKKKGMVLLSGAPRPAV